MTPPPTSTTLKPPQLASSTTHSLQTNFDHHRRSSKSTYSLNTDCGNDRSVNESSQKSTLRLFQSFQWSNVFNSRNSKSTSQLNLINCDKMNVATVAIPISDEPHVQLSKGLNYFSL